MGRATATWCLALAAFAQDDPRTPNAFLARGTPTFVRGTKGDDRSDGMIAGQVRLIRDMLFPGAPIETDSSIDLTRGAEGWPANPVLYGGDHVNRVVAEIEDGMPVAVGWGRLEVGDMKFEGDEYRLIAFVPARTQAPAHPDFLLYAGSGTPGVEEINSVSHGGDGFLVIDRFGPLVRGSWTVDADGTPTAKVTKHERRVPWRTTPTATAGFAVHRPELVPPSPAEDAQDAAVERGILRAEKALIAGAQGCHVYVYPDRRSKLSLTANGGDGHADVCSQSLHVLAVDSAEGGALESLVAHEITHVISCKYRGVPASPFLGEGLAVWASGVYAGRTLAQWIPQLPADPPPLAELFGAGFRKLPEQQAYPLAGVFVSSAIAQMGLLKFYRLYDLPLAEWGGDAEKLDAAFRAALKAR